MKKYLLLFVLFSAAAILYLSFPVNSKKHINAIKDNKLPLNGKDFYSVEGNYSTNPKEHFVFIKDNKFQLDGKVFYPVAVNYLVSLRADKNGMWSCPYFGYTPDSLQPCTTKDSCLTQLRADMELIKEMGFNAVRLVGIGEDDIDKKTGELTIRARRKGQSDTTIVLASDKSYNTYFNALSQLFKAINEVGLKSVFLIRLSLDSTFTDDHLKRVAARFKNDTSILAYDLFNEPLYFDHQERTKTDVYKIVKRWHKIIKMYAPNQLCTIGLVGIREVFKWDPNILDVDFISLHPYEVEPEQVRNEIYWYGKYIKKPWVIGETGIPANNDSITYEKQKKWAQQTLKQAYACGASGFTWWQYKEVDWHQYHANYLGVVSRKGETKTAKNNLIVRGTVKPVAEAFHEFNPSAKKDSGIFLPNYYNYSNGKAFRIIGKLVDAETNKPIKGGVALAWDEWWIHSYHTISKEDGSFELLGVYPFYHWIASATMYSMTRGELAPNTAKTQTDNIPTINIGTLKLQKLSLEQ